MDNFPKIKKRKTKVPVPNSKKDEKYYERRKKNNLSARRSRLKKKISKKLKEKKLNELLEYNTKLRLELLELEAIKFLYEFDSEKLLLP